MQDDARHKLSDLITEHEITMTFVHGAPRSGNFPGSNPWTVTLHRPDGRTYKRPFYMGPGLRSTTKFRKVYDKQEGRWTKEYEPAEPSITSFLDANLSDASSAESARDFSDFSSDLGGVSRASYIACLEAARDLRAFLGDLYETFLYAERE